MRDLGRHEEHVAGAKRRAFAGADEHAAAASHDVNLVAVVRGLRVDFAWSVEFDAEIAAFEDFDEIRGDFGEPLACVFERDTDVVVRDVSSPCAETAVAAARSGSVREPVRARG